jgi:hypothetical protein
MTRSRRFAIAALLAGSASLAWAQTGLSGGGLSPSAGLGGPSPLSPYGSVVPTGPGFDSTTPFISPLHSGLSGSSGLGTSTPSLGSYGNTMSRSADFGYSVPSPRDPGGVGSMADPLSPTTRFPMVNCHPGGCSGFDGTQYTRGAGNVMFGSNGKICQYTAPGAPLTCN